MPPAGNQRRHGRTCPDRPRPSWCANLGNAQQKAGHDGRAASLLIAFIALVFASPAVAGAVLDRVKVSGAIHCGAVQRPGLFDRTEAGPRGLLVDVCRAVGMAVAGRPVTVEMTLLDGPPSYDAIRAGRDDLYFLSGAEIVDQKLGGAILPGPVVFHETSALMVADGLPAQQPADLAGQPICFLQGDVSHRHLEAFYAARHLPFVRMGYQEEVEMVDAFDAQMCHGLAGEATTLAEIRRSGGKNRRSGRILAEPLASFPIVAATGTGDAAWSAVVAWTVAALQDADRPKGDWTAGGLDSLPVEAPELGLAAGWQKAVVATTGTYADMIRSTIGDGSRLKLPPGANALAGQGGLLAPLYAE